MTNASIALETSSLGPRQTVALRAACAFVWLATAVLYAHPAYRAVGAEYLARVGMPAWLMPFTCAGELVLGVRVLVGPSSTWLVAAQIGAIATFTAILGATEPLLLASPFGVLTKNLPMVACIATAWLVEREGWTGRAVWLLRAGVAVIWITEGLFPKILFQQGVELAIAARVAPWVEPSTLLRAIGVAQIAGGLAALLLRGRMLGVVLAAQAAALVALAAVMTVLDPSLWAHPFGPLTKNLPILVGTLVVRRQCCSSS